MQVVRIMPSLLKIIKEINIFNFKVASDMINCIDDLPFLLDGICTIDVLKKILSYGLSTNIVWILLLDLIPMNHIINVIFGIPRNSQADDPSIATQLMEFKNVDARKNIDEHVDIIAKMCSCEICATKLTWDDVKNVNNEHLIIKFIFRGYPIGDTWNSWDMPMVIKKIILKKHNLFYNLEIFDKILNDLTDIPQIKSFNAKCATMVLSKLDKWGYRANIYATYCMDKPCINSNIIIRRNPPNELKKSLVQHIYNYEYWCVMTTLCDLPREIAQYICHLMLTYKPPVRQVVPTKMIAAGRTIGPFNGGISLNGMGGYIAIGGATSNFHTNSKNRGL